jgi:hypothetical protein
MRLELSEERERYEPLLLYFNWGSKRRSIRLLPSPPMYETSGEGQVVDVHQSSAPVKYMPKVLSGR